MPWSVDAIEEGFDQSAGIEVMHRVAECTHARKNQLRRRPDIFRFRGDFDFMPKPSKRILDAPKVVQFVIHYRNHDVL